MVTFVSFVLFALVARYVLRNPYWTLPGRMLDYQLVQGSLGVLLAVPAALAGLRLGERMTASAGTRGGAHWALYRAAAVGSAVAGAASAIVLRG